MSKLIITDYEIKVNRVKSTVLQKLALSKGYSWCGERRVQFTEKPFLWIHTTEKELHHCEKSLHEEYVNGAPLSFNDAIKMLKGELPVVKEA